MTVQKDEVIGNLLGMTTPAEVTVCIDPEIARTNPLRIGEYLVIDYESDELTEPVLATVAKIGLENLNIPDSIMTSPQEFTSLFKISDLRDGEVLTAKVRILGYINEKGEIETPRFSPPPAAKVHRASVELLTRAFAVGHVRLGGLLTNQEVEVKLNVNELVRRHVAILSITGGGKGNTVAVVVSRILEMGGAVVIVDPHSEYVSMRQELGDKLVAFSVKGDSKRGIFPLKFKYSSFTASDYLSIIGVPSNAVKQMSLFRKAHKLLGTEWDYDDLLEALRQADMGVEEEEGEEPTEGKKKKKKKAASSQYHGLLDRMEGATEFEIFDKTSEVPLAGADTPGLVNAGKVTVLSLAGLDTDVQQAVVRRVAQKVYKGGIAWRRKEKQVDAIPCPVFLVIEESHNFIPNDYTPDSKRIIQRIASEGRKFGVGLCVVSQRPGRIDSTVLSQCNSMVVLRVVNPKDQTNIQNSAEAMSEEMLSELPSLNVGEAVIFGPAVNMPALVKVDKYQGKLGGEDVDIVKEWGRKERKKKRRPQKHGDDDAF
jgi:DNA helicase HerA-like ATPase